MLICVGSERVGGSRGPEMRGSEPSALPHLTASTSANSCGIRNPLCLLPLLYLRTFRTFFTGKNIFADFLDTFLKL